MTTQTTTPAADVVSGEAQLAAAKAQVENYVAVTGSTGTFADVAGMIEGERKVKLLEKFKGVLVVLRQGLRDNQIGIDRLTEEMAAKQKEIDYLKACEAALQEGLDSGKICGIHELNKFMETDSMKRLATRVANASKR